MTSEMGMVANDCTLFKSIHEVRVTFVLHKCQTMIIGNIKHVQFKNIMIKRSLSLINWEVIIDQRFNQTNHRNTVAAQAGQKDQIWCGKSHLSTYNVFSPSTIHIRTVMYLNECNSKTVKKLDIGQDKSVISSAQPLS